MIAFSNRLFAARPFAGGDADYADRVRVHNAYLPDVPTTAERLREGDGLRPKAEDTRDWTLEADGRTVGYALQAEAAWLREPGCRHIWLAVEPDLVGTPLHAEAVRWLTEQASEGADRLMTVLDDRWPGNLEVYQSAGFAVTQSNPVTRLDLDGFDPEPWRPAIERLEGEGFRFATVAELAAEAASDDPDAWRRPLYDLVWTLIADVPMPEPVQPEPYDEFVARVTSSLYDPASELVALDGKAWVGLTGLKQNPVDPTIGNTLLTGVRREYRRRGLAATLKASMLERARAKGVRRVFTDNEERNPMLDLNLRLGFREVYRTHVLSRMAADRS